MIDIKITRIEDETGIRFEVQIGPDGHVCRAGRTFWVDEDKREVDAEWEAKLFALGASAAVQVSADLAQRFLSPSPIYVKEKKGAA